MLQIYFHYNTAHIQRTKQRQKCKRTITFEEDRFYINNTKVKKKTKKNFHFAATFHSTKIEIDTNKQSNTTTHQNYHFQAKRGNFARINKNKNTFSFQMLF